MQLKIGPGKVYNYFGEGFAPQYEEKAPIETNTLQQNCLLFFLKLTTSSAPRGLQYINI